MKRALYVLLLLASCLCSMAQSTLEDVKHRLLNSPVQEKVYLHIDNTCYFKGDTIWYKAYVVRADSLTYTDMSRILYVELVSPDGLLVERQQIIVSDQGYSDGNFALQDSIYSGYYELRAYTRWMLNFRVSEHSYGRKDREHFYNDEMAKDFFRQFGTIYSRVFPVYERPEEPGDYALKYIVSRPKTRLEKEQKERLVVNFYPEGGHLVAGKRCNVAFEALNEEGEQVDIEGRVGELPIRTEHQGRGCFALDVPASGRLTADFNYLGKDYHIDLPKSERAACALTLSSDGVEVKASIAFGSYVARGLHYGAAVVCRGVLRAFEELKPDAQGKAVITFRQDELPTGVCDLLIVDETGQLLADRLFFVNNHDYGQPGITVTGGDTFKPYEQIRLTFQTEADASHISIAVRDGATDEPTYDTGNMMTDLLLSSELQGFIAYPDYYFEADDAEHRRALDLLMMVQGWRRYDYEEMTSKDPLRYKPETAITVEGSVYPTVDSNDYEPDEVRYWAKGIFGYSPSKLKGQESGDGEDQSIGAVSETLRKQYDEGQRTLDSNDGQYNLETLGGEALYVTKADGEAPASADNPLFGINHGGLHYEVTVESELVFEDDIATIKMETTNGGHFAFAVPPYYGQAILFMKAYKTDISEKKQKRLNTKGIIDEEEWPEFYVKRDLFYPVFAKKYSFYQCHQPDDEDVADVDDAPLSPSGERLSTFDRELAGVTVKKKRRRGRRAIDYSKPACVYDAQWLYNLTTDRGLSFGRYDAQEFPEQLSMALLGNYNSERQMNVKGRLNDRLLVPYVYYYNYNPGFSAMEQFRSDKWINDNLKLARQDEIRVYTDFELRNEDKHVEQQSNAPDVTIDFVLMENDAKRYTYRDRRLILDGMTEPALFYHPNYEGRALPDLPKDYRRTLYWNANAPLDDEGQFTATFYNNSKETRIKVSAAGLTKDGQPITTK
ncbi:MAG: hypothetical protein IJ243_07420 [Prevotella sp.]|nr:hypothetical protein [Prevotella sp.]